MVFRVGLDDREKRVDYPGYPRFAIVKAISQFVFNIVFYESRDDRSVKYHRFQEISLSKFSLTARLMD